MSTYHAVPQMVTANIIIQYMLTTGSIGRNAESLPLNVTTMDIADIKSRIQASTMQSATKVSPMPLPDAVFMSRM